MKKLFLSAFLMTNLLFVVVPMQAEGASTPEVTQEKINKIETEISDTKSELNEILDKKDDVSQNISILESKTKEIAAEKASIVDEKTKITNEVEALKAQIEKVNQELIQKEQETKAAAEAAEQARLAALEASGAPQFGSDGLLIEQSSAAAQNVINLLLVIPGHANGAAAHANIDGYIDGLSTAEAVYVIHRIEGAGFGQTGAGYAGTDSATTHQAFVSQQVNGRFGGNVRNLLKAWGTYSYGGY